MTKTNNFAACLYDGVLEQIHDVISALEHDISDGRQRVEYATARVVLDGIEGMLRQLMNDLRDSAEWNTFTIAFYGERNAGKSTLIECLRILLKEEGKQEQRQAFRALQKQFGLYEHDLNLLEQQADKFERRQADARQKMAEADHQYGQQETDLARKISELRQRISDSRCTASIPQRLFSRVRRLPEDAMLKQLQQQFSRLPEQHALVIERLQRQQHDAQLKHQNIMKQHQTALDNRHQLEAYEDGSIINSGRSGTSHGIRQYEFMVNGRSFRILDVPGIEVSNEHFHLDIQNAVKCAHAVFYVTHRAAPPSTDDDAETLERIKVHLGAQTEVWTVFNKPVSNPRVLRKVALVSNDDQSGLTELDRQMREALGRHYKRSTTLSALPGFLALADCLTPLSSRALSRKTFMDALTAERLLDASGVGNFNQLLMQEVIKDTESKIQHANANKIRVAIDSACTVIARLVGEQFLPLQDELHKETGYAGLQLDRARARLDKEVSAIGRQSIMAFGARVRQQINAQIEEDISNDEFEVRLQAIMEKEQGAVQDGLPEQFEGKVQQCQRQVAGIIERFEEHAKDILLCHERINASAMARELAIDVHVDRGIDLHGLIEGVVDGAPLSWAPVRWGMAPLGDVTLLTGLFKSIWGYFSDDYRKSQQRKAAEKNIRKAYRELSHALHQRQREALQPLKDKLEEINALLWTPVVRTKKVCGAIDTLRVQLIKVAEDVTKERKR
ncbi:AAA family ATPase [Zymobacter palmae]|uniref:Chromosome segregation ATPases n=1 Tax=Zymobacter palmae TaxID=33074 RepID=A0A348HGM6_9GAMM|nr:hypothetical protein [Zymobacter palmae]BBG30778.1 chromosome segregation ATPases [Zymobacter palmae]